MTLDVMTTLPVNCKFYLHNEAYRQSISCGKRENCHKYEVRYILPIMMKINAKYFSKLKMNHTKNCGQMKTIFFFGRKNDLCNWFLLSFEFITFIHFANVFNASVTICLRCLSTRMSEKLWKKKFITNIEMNHENKI